MIGPLGALAAILKQAPLLLSAADALVARSRRSSETAADIDSLRRRVAELEQHQQAHAALAKELADHASALAQVVQETANRVRQTLLVAVAGAVLATSALAVALLR
jgi:hypothetical protein